MQHRHSHVRRVHPRAVPLTDTIEGWVFVLAVAATVYFMQTGAIGALVEKGGEFGILSAFLSGLFFTSMVTAVPATYAIIESASYLPAWQLALMGGLGALAGNVIMFRLIRSKLSDRLLGALFHPRIQKIGRLLSSGPLWWTAPLFGAFAFASPLPDEIGIVMMGVAHLSFTQLALFAFVSHVVGIYAIAKAAQLAL